MPLDPEAARAIVARYPSPRSAILPLLWLGQQADGYVTEETAQEVARLVGVPESEVESVLSFYTMFRREPPARRRLEVCRSLACAMRGAEEILTGVTPGHAAPDGSFSVSVVECIAACDHAPAYLFNDRMGGPLTPELALALLRGEAEARRRGGEVL
jgi:NADH-quinone oxidoreductase subunit E